MTSISVLESLRDRYLSEPPIVPLVNYLQHFKVLRDYFSSSVEIFLSTFVFSNDIQSYICFQLENRECFLGCFRRSPWLDTVSKRSYIYLSTCGKLHLVIFLVSWKVVVVVVVSVVVVVAVVVVVVVVVVVAVVVVAAVVVVVVVAVVVLVVVAVVVVAAFVAAVVVVVVVVVAVVVVAVDVVVVVNINLASSLV